MLLIRCLNSSKTSWHWNRSSFSSYEWRSDHPHVLLWPDGPRTTCSWLKCCKRSWKQRTFSWRTCTSVCFGKGCRGLVSQRWCGHGLETKKWAEGTAVESEQGWFSLALYNLSNLFLMLTVQYFVSHFRKKRCVNSHLLSFESEHGNNRGSHKVLFVTLQYISKHPFCSFL